MAPLAFLLQGLVFAIQTHMLFGLPNMAKGAREVFIQSLKDAGFTADEAEALASAWTKSICPAVVALFDDIAMAIREEVRDRGAALTNDTTKQQFRIARELFILDRFVLSQTSQLSF